MTSASPSYPSDDEIGQTLVKAREAVVEAMKEAGLPADWWIGQEALLRINLVVAAAAPVIEEAVCEWFEKEMLPLIIETIQGRWS
jgi:hypothetical protein